MSKEPLSSPASAANRSAAAAHATEPESTLQDLLAEKTLAMIGGAPHREVKRVDELAQTQLDRAHREHPSPADEAGAAASRAEPAIVASDEEPAPAAPDASHPDDEASASDATAEAEVPAASLTERPLDSEPAEAEAFRFSNPEDRAVAQIAQAKGIPLAEAARLFHGDSAGSRASAGSPTVAQLEAELEQIERRLDGSGGEHGAWNAEVAGLVKQHSKAAAALHVARLAAQHEAARQQAFESERHAVLADAVKHYPDLGNPASALWKVAAQLAREAHDPKHPDHRAGQSVNAPRFFAEKAAALLRTPPGSGSSTPPAAGRGATASRAKPASGARQTLPHPPAPTLHQRVASAQAKTLAMIRGHRGAPSADDSAPLLIL